MMKSVILVVMVALAGCATTPADLYKEADKAAGFHEAEWKAFATYAVWTVYHKQGAALLNDPNVPAAFKKGMAVAEQRVHPVMESLVDAWLIYVDARNKLTGEWNTQQRLAIAVANLTDWTTRAKLALDGFIYAFRAAKPAGPSLSDAERVCLGAQCRIVTSTMEVR